MRYGFLIGWLAGLAVSLVFGGLWFVRSFRENAAILRDAKALLTDAKRLNDQAATALVEADGLLAQTRIAVKL